MVALGNTHGTMFIGGEERPFHVNGTRQRKQFTDTLDIPLSEYWNRLAKMSVGQLEDNESIGAVFIWSALYAGAVFADKQNRTCDFKYQDVIDWIEEIDPSDEKAVQELWKPGYALVAIIDAKKKLMNISE